jgi:hypothetical protein
MSIGTTRYPTGKVAPTGPPLNLWGGPVGARFTVRHLVGEIKYRENTWFVVHVDFAKIKRECILGSWYLSSTEARPRFLSIVKGSNDHCTI